MFTRAITREPGKSLAKGLSSANLGKPDLGMALIQHKAYVKALESCGLEVTVIEADEEFPDSTFVEDAALLTSNCAIITRPGALSRRGETESIKHVLEGFYENIEEVQDPGTVEAGDIMMVGSHFFIGLSDRTNENGACQVISFLEKYGLTGSMERVEDMLHFKTGIAYLENNTIVAAGPFLKMKKFQKFNIIPVDTDEIYAANCIWVNGTVLVAKGFPKIAHRIKKAGYSIIELDMSEFQKLDGGLSCLSLRF